MQSSRAIQIALLVILIGATTANVSAQRITTTVTLGSESSGLGAIAVNEATNKIYAANQRGIWVVDGNTNVSTLIITSDEYYLPWLAVNSNTNKIYAHAPGLGLQSNRLVMIDGATNSVTELATIPVPSNETSIVGAINSQTNKVYVSCGDKMLVIDGVTNSVTSLDVPSGPRRRWLAVNPASNKVYTATDQTNVVFVLDGATNSLTSFTVGSPHEPWYGQHPIAVNPTTNRVYIGGAGSSSATGTVSVLDGSTNATVAVLDTLFLPLGLVVSTGFNKTYITSSYGGLYVIDGATNSITVNNAFFRPTAIAPNPSTGTLFVQSEDTYPFAAMNESTGVVSRTKVFLGPMELNTATNRVYLLAGSDLAVIDASVPPPTTTPYGVGVTGGRVYWTKPYNLDTGNGYYYALFQDAALGTANESNGCYFRFRIDGSGIAWGQLADDAGVFSTAEFQGGQYAFRENAHCKTIGIFTAFLENPVFWASVNTLFKPSWAGRSVAIYLRASPAASSEAGPWVRHGTVTVGPASPGTFTITTTPVSVVAPGRIHSWVMVNPLGGFSDDVYVFPDGTWPAGFSGPSSLPRLQPGGGSNYQIDVDGSVAPGNYQLPIVGISASSSVTATILVTVGDGALFTLSAAQAFGPWYNQGTGQSIEVPRGAQGATSTITITPVSGFIGVVAVSENGWPTGFSPVNLPLNYRTNFDSPPVVLINVSSDVPAGDYLLPIRGTNGSRTVTANIPIRVVAANTTGLAISPIASSTPVNVLTQFTVDAPSADANIVNVWFQDPASGVNQPLSSCYVRVLSNSAYYLADDAGNFGTHSYLGETWGASKENSQCFVDGPGSTRVTLGSKMSFGLNMRFKSAWAGKRLKVFLQRQTTTYLTSPWYDAGAITVTQAAQPSFTMSGTSASGSVGGSASSTVTISPLNGFNSAVTLAGVNWPSGITGTFGTNPTLNSSAVAISIGTGVAAGSYTLNVSGTGGTLTANTTIALTVTAGGGTLPFGVSVTPQAGSGPANVAQNLQFVWGSPAGQPALSWGTLLIQDSASPTPNVVNACLIRVYTGGAGQLADNAGSLAGASNTFLGETWTVSPSNAQCQLNGPQSSRVTVAGSTMQVSLSLLLKTAWAGKTLSIWLQATNTLYQTGSWLQMGTFTVAGGSPSFSLSATPAAAAAGASATSTVSITPSNGFNSAVTLSTVNWPAGITGTFGTNPASTTSVVTINVAAGVTAGSYTLNVSGASGSLTANTAIGLTVTASTGGTLPFGVSVTPAAGSGAANVAQSLQFVWGSPAGQPGLAWGTLLIQDASISQTPVMSNACAIRVNAGGSAQLANNAGSFGGAVNTWVGESWSVSPSNGQCQLNGPQSSRVVLSGTNVQANLNLVFKSGWAGKTLSIWLQGTNTSYQSGTWQQLGTFTIAPEGGGGGTLPFGVSVTPAAGSGAANVAQGLQFVWSSPAGQPGLVWGTLLIQDASAAAPVLSNACAVRVYAGGSAQLADNAGSFDAAVNTWIGEPWSASPANGQCQLNGPQSSRVVLSGSNMQAALNLVFRSGWAGKTLSIWMQGTNTSYQTGTWQQLGTFRVLP